MGLSPFKSISEHISCLHVFESHYDPPPALSVWFMPDVSTSWKDSKKFSLSLSLQRSFRSFANDDRHVMAKHASIYPAPEELEAVQTLVSTVEGALKKVSDWMDNLSKSSGKTSTNNEAGDDTVEEDAAEKKYVPRRVLFNVCTVTMTFMFVQYFTSAQFYKNAFSERNMT